MCVGRGALLAVIPYACPPGGLRDLPAIGGLHDFVARPACPSCGGDVGQGAGRPGEEHHGVDSGRAGEVTAMQSQDVALLALECGLTGQSKPHRSLASLPQTKNIRSAVGCSC